MSARHFSDEELDKQLSGYEETSAWLERRARRLLGRRHLSHADRAELAQLRAHNTVLLRDVEQLPVTPDEAA